MATSIKKRKDVKLELYLESRNISRKEFAEMVGITRQAVDNYCSKRRMPTLDIAVKIVKLTKEKVGFLDLIC